MKITTFISLDGVRYEFDRLQLAEARMLKQLTDYKPDRFGQELFSGDPDALTALIVIMKARQGERVRFEEVDGDLTTLEIEFRDEKGRVVTPKLDSDGEPVYGADKSPVLLFDGVEDEDPTVAPVEEPTT